MPMIDAFLPAPAGSVTIAVGAASAYTALPAPGEYLELQNTGAATVFVELSGNQNGAGQGANPAVIATSYPILAGQSKVIRRSGSAGISTISAAGGQSLVVSVGNGV